MSGDATNRPSKPAGGRNGDIAAKDENGYIFILDFRDR